MARRTKKSETKRRPTIGAVAESVGLSPTAVSLIINHPNKYRYSTATRKRVHNAVRKLGYKPNVLARSLRKGKTNPGIGFLCTSIEDVNITQAVHRAIELAATESLHVVVSTQPQKIAWQYLLEEGRVGWLIATGEYHIRELSKSVLPWVLDRAVVIHPSKSVCMPAVYRIFWDAARHGILAVDHLAELGHKEIAILAGDCLDLATATPRIAAAYTRAQELGISAHWITNPKEDQADQATLPSSAELMTKQVLKGLPDVTAIICRNDYHAVGVYRQLFRAGLRVPKDFSIIGNLNLQEALHLDPGLTSIEGPLVEAVGRAMKFIIGQEKQMAPKSSRVRDVDLTDHIKLIVRKSCSKKNASSNARRHSKGSK